jgi:hypothetical protein
MNPVSDESVKRFPVGPKGDKDRSFPVKLFANIRTPIRLACPQDGITVSLILPHMDTVCMNVFLKELSERHSNEHIGLVWDGASGHRGKALVVPDNMTLIPLPPYSPELNPVENFWKELKKQGFYNRVFQDMKDVEDLLEKRLKHFEDNPQKVQSIVGYSWILSALR